MNTFGTQQRSYGATGGPRSAYGRSRPTVGDCSRTSRSVLDLSVKSVLKKWKDKAFAAGVDRKVIEKGAALMGVPLEELIADTIEGMKTVAESIGLKGNPDVAPSA